MTDAPVSRIRNFCIIAHIDHGKSTLADRLLQDTGTVANRDMQDQFLDNMDLERERGITIKLQAARMNYTAADGEEYVLNLIDTPGHVDFSYEVSRSLQACEGALLVVDASQGVEAQTLANVYLALDNDLEIIPVLNKIDLPGADPDRIKEEVEAIIGLDCSNAIPCSAKTGMGVPEILQAVVDRVPPPKDAVEEPTKALIFDSYYDPYRGVIVYFRVMSGRINCKDKVLLMASKKTYELDEIGIMAPDQKKVDELHAGEVGYLAASIKAVADARVGDTITLVNAPADEPLPGYTEAKPMVFCGLFPTEADQYPDLRDALDKLQLSDAALKYEPETSSAMGFGFRCGFLGLLHMEIVQERLEREYDLDLIVTAPSVIYKVNMIDGSEVMVDNPATLPDPQKRESIEEPYVRMEIYAPNDYNGALMGLCQERRGRLHRHEIHHHRSGDVDLRITAGGGGDRLLRSDEDAHPGLCLDGIQPDRLPQEPVGAAGCADQRRAGRCPHHDRPPRQGLQRGQGVGGETQGTDSPPAVQDSDSGVDRQPDHCLHQHQCHPQGCARQTAGSGSAEEAGQGQEADEGMGKVECRRPSWRRHFTEEETAEEAGQGQEADEGHGQGDGQGPRMALSQSAMLWEALLVVGQRR